MKCNRVIVIVLDGVGVGELPDAASFGDTGSNSLSHVGEYRNGLCVPNLQKMGLGNLTTIKCVLPLTKTTGAYGKMNELSKGKDSIIGHWELAGLVSPKPLPVYPEGFPKKLISEFEKKINRKVIGNKAASGTSIIEELGKEHINTGYPIVYTSGDSVFQIAAHEKIISVSKLYDYCKIARSMLRGMDNIGRVIARPFIGQPGNFVRTEQRKDFSLKPPNPTILDKLSDNGFDVISVGKIDELFSFEGITQSFHTVRNDYAINKTIDVLTTNFKGLLFVNLIEFDMLYGHRNNPDGYATALENFDSKIPHILNNMNDQDILIITSDHGNDPTTPTTDHSREYVPILVNGKYIKSGINLGIRSSFTDVGASIAEIFNIKDFDSGTSFISEICSPEFN